MGDLTESISSVGGSAISGAASFGQSGFNAFLQDMLADQQYKRHLTYLREVGATPAAIAQGLAGGAAGSTPTLSTGPGLPDLGQTSIGAMNAQTNKDVGQSTIDLQESEALYNQMRLRFEPAKYFADIRKSLSEAFNQTKQGLYYGSLKENIDELTTDFRLIRPWKIATAIATLNNLLAEHDKITSETAYNNARTSAVPSEIALNKAQARNFDADTEYKYSLKFNVDQDSYRIMYENQLRSIGINPNKGIWENLLTTSFTHPQNFDRRLNTIIQALNILDGKLKENLGEHYKRNAALGFLGYKYAKGKSEAFNRLISSVVPIGIGAALAPATGGMSLIGSMPAFMSNSTFGY